MGPWWAHGLPRIIYLPTSCLHLFDLKFAYLAAVWTKHEQSSQWLTAARPGETHMTQGHSEFSEFSRFSIVFYWLPWNNLGTSVLWLLKNKILRTFVSEVAARFWGSAGLVTCAMVIPPLHPDWQLKLRYVPFHHWSQLKMQPWATQPSYFRLSKNCKSYWGNYSTSNHRVSQFRIQKQHSTPLDVYDGISDK